MAARSKPRVSHLYVTIGDQTYEPGHEFTAEQVKLIDNPSIWGDTSEDDSGDEA